MERVLLVLLAAACCSYAFERLEIYEKTELGTAIDFASTKLLKEAYDSAQDKNVIASPLGLFVLLAFYSTGLDEPAKEEIVKTLGAFNYTELYVKYIHLSEKFTSLDPSYFVLANKVYVSNQYNLVIDFYSASRSFHSAAEEISFSNPKTAADIINRWAEEKSQGHIKNAVPEDALTPDVAAALFNIIFFQGHWHVPFKANETTNLDFHVDDNTVVKKPTMYLSQTLQYGEDKELGATMIELPYKQKDFRMIIYLPDQINGLPKMMQKAGEIGLLDSTTKMYSRQVTLYLPKFEIENVLDLNDILPKIGVSKIFTEGAPGIVKERPVVVSKAFQKAFIKVDEEGATAGAFTGIVVVPVCSTCGPPPPVEFRVDRPFLFSILHRDRTVFVGTYTH